MTLVLEVTGLRKQFAGLVATDDVSLQLERGARHALIGPNGAGKTTLINLLTGVQSPTAGKIVLDGEDITAMPRHRRVARGIVRTFQINQLFLDMTPLQAVALATSRRLGFDRNAWRKIGSSREVIRESVAVLERFDLVSVMSENIRGLPYGKQRLLEIALAIACGPRILLLDEPAAGVPENGREDIIKAVSALPADVSILLIEHDMDLVFRFAQQIWVLASGRLIASGTAREIAANRQVREVYLGDEERSETHA